MKTNFIRVALNMRVLSIANKITKSRTVYSDITGNAQVFTNPDPAVALIPQAATDLENAAIAAEDGGVSKTATMHDMEAALMLIMNKVGHYVEAVANDKKDATIVLLAGLDVKKDPVRSPQDFVVQKGDASGSVSLRVKPQDKVLYKWQYCKDPMGSNPWVDISTTTVSKTSISGLIAGVYWFRVVIADVGGEHAGQPEQFIVK